MTRKFAVQFLTVVILLALGAPMIAAAQSSDSVTLTADLGEPVCAIDLRLASGSFGTWEWNGAEYVNTSYDNVHIAGDIVALPHDGRCTVVVSFAGLSGPGGGTIPSSSFFGRFSIGPGGQIVVQVDGWSRSFTARTAVPISGLLNIYLGMYDIPPSLTPGTYTGDLTVTITNAA